MELETLLIPLSMYVYDLIHKAAYVEFITHANRLSNKNFISVLPLKCILALTTCLFNKKLSREVAR